MENYKLKNYLKNAIEDMKSLFYSERESLKKIGMPIEDYLDNMK